MPPRNTKALAEAVVRLVRDTRLREGIIEHMIADRQTRFDWGNIAIDTIGIYERLMNEKSVS